MLDKFSIRGLLTAGFGLVVLILVINSVMALHALQTGARDVQNLTGEDYPAVARVNEVQQRLQESAAFLGFYLMSDEQGHHDAWLESMDALQTAAITTAMPFSVILLLMCLALVRSLRGERVLRQDAAGRAWLEAQSSSAGPGRRQRAPLGAATPPDGFTGARPGPLGVAERKEDWRERLKFVIRGHERYTGLAAQRQAELMPEIQRFLDQVANPALEEIQAELEQYQRQVQVTRGDDQTGLTVWSEGDEEFTFVVHGLLREPLSFAFPEFTLAPEEIEPRVEIILPTGRLGDWPLDELSADQLRDEFVTAYARWMGW